MTWLWVLLTFSAGAIFGVVMMCCFIAAGKEDKRIEKLNANHADTE